MSGLGSPGAVPGGGGGAADFDSGSHDVGGNGAAGKVELVYTPPAAPTNNVIRFIMLVPPHGGNNGKVLLRALTGGTLVQLDCLYVTGGKVQLKGYTSGPTLAFTSSNLTVGDGQPVMVSMELVNSGANVAYTLAAIIPGATALLGSVTGTQTTASIGNITEVIAAPNHDITKTAMGHISVQYALVPLVQVSNALNGHVSEMTVDRFIRLGNEQALDNVPQYNETADHWGFETGTVQSWTATNASVSNSTVSASGLTAQGGGGAPLITNWPAEGTHSLLITAAGGAGFWEGDSPGGTSGQPINASDRVSVNADVYCPAALGAVYCSVIFWTSAGGRISSTNSPFLSIPAGGTGTAQVAAIAPATSAFFSVAVGDNETKAASTLLYCDNIRVTPRMGPQTRKEYKSFLHEVRNLDQGIMKELKTAWGLGYKTRIAITNQSPAVTIDYSLAQLSGDLKPVVDDLLTKNHITVKRRRGSSVTVTLNNGSMSVQEPPSGVGRYKKGFYPGAPMIGIGSGDIIAEVDEQLAALASHLLSLGTVQDERYPNVSVQLARTEVASIMSALAGIEIGDYIKIINLPFWFPSSTVNQMVIGYTETIGPYQWDITWNCKPYSPYIISASSIRRW